MLIKNFKNRSKPHRQAGHGRFIVHLNDDSSSHDGRWAKLTIFYNFTTSSNLANLEFTKGPLLHPMEAGYQHHNARA